MNNVVEIKMKIEAKGRIAGKVDGMCVSSGLMVVLGGGTR